MPMKTITIAKVKNLITARPKEMPFEVYRKLRKEQQMMLHGYNVIEMQGSTPVRKHIPGRLEGVQIPASEWTRSRDFQIVLR